MEIAEFALGVTYRMTLVPYLDCDPNEEIQRVLTVLTPATPQNSRVDDGESLYEPTARDLAEWGAYLRVRDPKGNVRLQSPALIIRAERIE